MESVVENPPHVSSLASLYDGVSGGESTACQFTYVPV